MQYRGAAFDRFGVAHFEQPFFRSVRFCVMRTTSLVRILVGLVLLVSAEVRASLPPQMDSLMSVWSDEIRPIDQRFYAIDEAFSRFYEQQPDALLPELEKLRDLAEANERPLILYEAFNRKAIILNFQGKNQEALPIYDQAERVAQAIGDTLRMGTVAANRGNVYAGLGEYLKATEEYTLALERYQAAGHLSGERSVRMALGNVFVIIDSYDLGKAYYEEVFDQLGESTSDRFRGLLSMNMGWCEYKLGNFESADAWYAAAESLFEKEKSGFFLLGLYGNQGALHFDRGRFDAAQVCAQNGLDLSRSLGAEKDAFSFQLLLAKIALQTDAQRALAMAQAIESELTSMSEHETKRNFYELMYLAHKELGLIAQALNMHEKFLAYRDSMQMQKDHNLVLRTAYEKEIEHRLFAVEMQGKQERSELRIKQLQTVIALVLAFVLVTAVLVFYILHIQKRDRLRRGELLRQIDELRASRGANLMVGVTKNGLDRNMIESSIGKSLNETDWTVLNILLEDPSVTNAKIAETACMSVDGIGSSLRRMYDYFDIKETKYKKIALLHAALQLSA